LQNGAALNGYGVMFERPAAVLRAALLCIAAAIALIIGLAFDADAGPLAALSGLSAAAEMLAVEKVQVPGAGRNTPGNFDFYVFSLSWSPSFCETPAAERARGQCETGANLGFVVHGLWPQYARGFPLDCSPAGRVPSRVALEGARDLYPSEGLARHEWAKHGTCSGKSPTDYFADVRRARDTVAIPVPFATANETQTWAPIDIMRGFIAANPRLRPGMLGVICQNGALQEVRICFSKDLREFQNCQEISRQGCRAGEISVPPTH
jgi:ribonuclease T2